MLDCTHLRKLDWTLSMLCPLCQSQDTLGIESFFNGCFQCRHCGFVYSDQVDTSDPQLYDEAWARSEVHPTFIYQNGQFVVRNEALWGRILHKLEPFRSLNRLLGVGCSAAFFLTLARSRGWGVQGVEMSDFGVNYSRKVLGIDVQQGTLQEVALPAESFDVVFSSHVLEHINDPRELVREMVRILRPKGGAGLCHSDSVRVTCISVTWRPPGRGPAATRVVFYEEDLRKTHGKRETQDHLFTK